LHSSTHFQHYRGTWEGRVREGENGRGENGRGFDEFLWESNVQLKCGTVYLLEVVG
jgi:inosine/xanthosine triphosphate pyrophosphatase family protein